jgi:7-carboxy-7-deazaguanine synthase
MIPVHEILATIQGEGLRAGRPCVLVRTLGCNLRCRWCDTDQEGVRGRWMTVGEVVDTVRAAGLPLVEITGGEPLLHEETPELAAALSEAEFEVLVETNGTLDPSVLPAGTVRIVDLKPPSSGESGRIRWEVLDGLDAADELKIVIADEVDYAWARETMDARLRDLGARVLLSPLTPGLDGGRLASWILRDRLDVTLNVQLHKLLFPAGEPPLSSPTR